MRLLYTLVFPMLPISLLLYLGVAKPLPDHAIVVSLSDTQPPPMIQLRRRELVHGLPPGWLAVFQTVASIQPPLINPAFIQFFSVVAKRAAADSIPGHHYQRIPFGALVLEFVAMSDQDQIVTKEFVQAACLFLLDAAQKGWTGFFKAWVRDMADGEIVFIRLTTMWDETVPLSW